jgi:SAM-dependent methyltransferase
MKVEAPPLVRDEQALRRHYEVERELANRLRRAGPEERLVLYRSVYNELFQRVPDHPQLSRKQGGPLQRDATARQMALLRRFLRPDHVFLEIGAGDCHLAKTVSAEVRHVYAVDVSDEISGGNVRPPNFSLIVTDGIRIDVARASVDVAYSHQLMEHLHPDDAAAQLKQVYQALRPGGVYVCTTPHRFSGPHDVSKHFDSVAQGFHLKEYSYGDLRRIFRQTGFSRTRAWAGIKGRFFWLPNALTSLAEGSLRIWPANLRKRIACLAPFRPLFDSVTIVGQKSAFAVD